MFSTLALTLSDRLFPASRAWLRDLGLVLAGTLLVALLAQVRIPLPFTPVPITGQTFAVLLVAVALGSHRGAVSLMLYATLGLGGLPVFAGGASGLAYALGPTGGYLVGFALAAWVVGRLAERGLERTVRTAWLPFLAGTLVIYLCGAGWLSFVLGSLPQALAVGVLPFLVGDTVKILLAALALPAAWRLVKP
ncbi:MAG: biotin transporter BioY [Chloroflexota bacterium]